MHLAFYWNTVVTVCLGSDIQVLYEFFLPGAARKETAVLYRVSRRVMQASY